MSLKARVSTVLILGLAVAAITLKFPTYRKTIGPWRCISRVETASAIAALLRYSDPAKSFTDGINYFAHWPTGGVCRLASLEIETLDWVPGQISQSDATNSLNLQIGISSWVVLFTNGNYVVRDGKGNLRKSVNPQLVFSAVEAQQLVELLKGSRELNGKH